METVVVYKKSDKAMAEFNDGNRSLSLRHRQLLIMVDGRRSNRDLAKTFGSDDVLLMLSDLEKLGFLINPYNTSSLSASQANVSMQVAKPDDALSQQHIVFIKTFLTQEAQLQLGLMSREIEQKIALVKNSEDLKSCIARWHMAIRDSKNGRTVADKLMERLAHLMANAPQTLASQSAS